MGWKANCILLSEQGGPVFSTFPAHQPERARRVMAELGFANHVAPERCTFEEAVCLRDGRVGIGAYDGGLILSGVDIDSPEKESVRQLVQSLFRLYPAATLLELGLISTVNFFHYKLWVAGRLVRHYAGDSDHGVTADIGDFLPVEEPHFRNSELRGKERIFFVETRGERHEFDTSAYGEVLVFSAAGLLLGKELDRYDGDKLDVELHSPPRPTAFVGRPWWKFWC